MFKKQQWKNQNKQVLNNNIKKNFKIKDMKEQLEIKFFKKITQINVNYPFSNSNLIKLWIITFLKIIFFENLFKTKYFEIYYSLIKCLVNKYL